MNGKVAEIKEIEKMIEETLWTLEVNDEIEEALGAYLEAETKLGEISVSNDKPAYFEMQRVLAYCLMRQSNLLRQMGKAEEALVLGDREIVAAKASKDDIALTRSLMSNGTNRIITGDVNGGLEMLEKARELFEGGDSYDHQQGLGWYWILQADLANAGIFEKTPAEIIDFADRAMKILMPIENWPGVARAYSSRAEAHSRMGNEGAAANDKEKQKYFESIDEPDDKAG